MYNKLGRDDEEEDRIATTASNGSAKRLGGLVSAIVIFVVIIAGLAIASGAIIGTKKHKTQYSYGIMMDAGTTGTRAHIYRWPECPLGDVPIIDTSLSALKVYRVEPGLSSISISEIPSYINNFINWASNNIPAQKISQTPIFLKATAGLRILPEDEQKERIGKVRETLNESQFKFSDESWASVISGEDEGVFGWISTNFATGTLFDALSKPRTGALDMGGTSIQITFYPKDEVIKEGAYNVVMPGVNYTLYTHSFLGLGINAFIGRIENRVISNATDVEEVYFPCYPSGYSKEKENTTLKGTGNVTECRDIIRSELNIGAQCNHSTCSLNGTYQPSLDGNDTFYATGSYPYIGSFFGLSDVLESSPEDLEKETLEYCALTWEEIIGKYPSEDDESLSLYCFEGIYDTVLLTEGYGFNYTQKRIVFSDYVDEIPLGWPLGAMIYEVSRF